MKAEIYVLVKECQRLLANPPEARRNTWNRFSIIALRWKQPCQYLDLGLLASRTVSINVCCFSHPFHILLQQPQQTNIAPQTLYLLKKGLTFAQLQRNILKIFGMSCLECCLPVALRPHQVGLCQQCDLWWRPQASPLEGLCILNSHLTNVQATQLQYSAK